MRYRLITSDEYGEWVAKETMKSRVQVAKRLSAIEIDGYFGDHKDLEGEVCELRWKNGRRVYYACVPESSVILLLGGNKNGQDKDITQAKKILKKWSAQNED